MNHVLPKEIETHDTEHINKKNNEKYDVTDELSQRFKDRSGNHL